MNVPMLSPALCLQTHAQTLSDTHPHPLPHSQRASSCTHSRLHGVCQPAAAAYKGIDAHALLFVQVGLKLGQLPHPPAHTALQQQLLRPLRKQRKKERDAGKGYKCVCVSTSLTYPRRSVRASR
eukprot:1157289-Pelagomonas_calceolata.AAC.4